MKYIAFATLTLALAATGCQSLDEQFTNPNLPTADSPVPPSLLLPRIEYDLYGSGDGGPFSQVQRWNQYTISNDSYYGGQNQYNWTTTASLYTVLKNVNQMDAQAVKLLGTKQNAYSALAKFFRAYLFVWQAQRVGDTPASQAGQGLANLTPAYDTQKAVYARSLAMLDTANTMLAQGTALTGATQYSGDIYYSSLSPLVQLAQWRKVVNSYRLRVLISLSKRAVDNADLRVPQQFATIINNPSQYPLLASNADNWAFQFNTAYNTYPHTPNDTYNARQNAGAPYLSLTTATQDPRTFVTATPAPAQIAAGKQVGDFSAYVGSTPALGLSDLSTASNAGRYSFTNFLRYYSSVSGPEAYTLLGYAEQNFNIAEAANRGWVSGISAATYYQRGINASLDSYGLTEGQVLAIGDAAGKPFGTATTLPTVTVSRSAFLANAGVVYKGDNATGLEQILNQKYVAFFQNSGYEPFYNWRRTGYPTTFVSTGSGLNANGRIPRRWQYPVDEQTYNTTNYQAALQSQFGGTDDLSQDTWLTK
jgi:hypothetical protein